MARGKSVRNHTSAMLWSHAFYWLYMLCERRIMQTICVPTGSVRCSSGYSTDPCGLRNIISSVVRDSKGPKQGA